MKNIVIVFFLVLFGQLSNAQNLRNPLSREDNYNGLTGIVSDWGPRNYPENPNASKFHSGLDYTLPNNGPAYAIQGGSFQYKRSGTTNENSYVKIEGTNEGAKNFVYMHIYWRVI
jgi:hypothetical protein